MTQKNLIDRLKLYGSFLDKRIRNLSPTKDDIGVYVDSSNGDSYKRSAVQSDKREFYRLFPELKPNKSKK